MRAGRVRLSRGRELGLRMAEKVWEILRILAAFSAIAAAQTPAAPVRVEVRDTTGAPLEAAVRLVPAQGAAREGRADAQGSATFDAVPYGAYRVEVRQKGFAEQTAPLDIRGAAPVVLRVTLELRASRFSVDVVGSTPLGAEDQPLEQIPAPVVRLKRDDLDESGAAAAPDLLNRRLNGVHINEIQGNPYQPDVNYRGYTASPLLGTPQGLSVYLDGVRLNQPFGDVVSWDLIPLQAVADATLMPGSNPLFGLNTLGGALSLRTKDGLSDPGTTLELSGGSFGRKVASLEHGGSAGNGWNWYGTGTLFFEDGWRPSSPSDVRQFFGRVGRNRGRSQISLGLGYDNNSLTGNGLQEMRLLEQDYASVYTKPDITNNRAVFANLAGRTVFSNGLTFSGNAYYRFLRSRTLNGDINEDSLSESVYQPNAAERAALTAAGYTGFPVSGANASNTPFPSWRCIAQALLGDEPAEKCNGLLNSTGLRQHNYGFAGQLSSTGPAGGLRNQWTIGAAFDRSLSGFRQLSELGYLTPDRGINGVGAFGDGVTGGTEDGEPFDTRVGLDGRTHTASIYATDTLRLTRQLFVTVAGRYNHTTLRNLDRIVSGPGSLDGTHTFGRFQPAVGFTYSPHGLVNFYANYSEASRAPTSIELGCADPAEPCKLPNAMAGDPPLRQVVTRTMEAGVRGGLEGHPRWSAGWFRASNRDDILFVASTQTGYGYFKNFGRTQRQGLELSVDERIRAVTFGANYTFLDATYQSTEAVSGTGNSTNTAVVEGGAGLDGTIDVQPGDRIPLTPRHQWKGYVHAQAARRLSFDLGVVGMSRSYARGNENNLHQPDGVYFLGPGESPGYAVVQAGARFRASQRFELFVQATNLLNRRYYTAAQLGATGFTAQGSFLARPFPSVDGEYPQQQSTFYAPGAPRAVTGGVRIRLF